MESKATTTSSAKVVDEKSDVDVGSDDSGEISDGEIFDSDEEEAEQQKPRIVPNFLYQPDAGDSSTIAADSSETAGSTGIRGNSFFRRNRSFAEPHAAATQVRDSSPSTAFAHGNADTSEASAGFGSFLSHYYSADVNPFYVSPQKEPDLYRGPRVEIVQSFERLSPSGDSLQPSFLVKDCYNNNSSSNNNFGNFNPFPKPEENALGFKTAAPTDPFHGYLNSGSQSSWLELDRSVNPFHQGDVDDRSCLSSLLGPPPDPFPVFEASTPKDPEKKSRKFIYINPAKLASLVSPVKASMSFHGAQSSEPAEVIIIG